MQAFLIILYVYFVSFLDKPEKTTPQLSPRAVEQRTKWHILTDEMDYPVSPMYMDSLHRMGAEIYHQSRWFNGVTCEMTPTLAAKVEQLHFVTDVEMTRDDSPNRYLPKRKQTALQRVEDIKNWTDEQLKTYNLLPLHQAGYEGQGILISVCDGGFYNANTMNCFRQSQELGHFDFTDDVDDFYGSTGAHGSECLSIISGILTSEHVGYYGAATQANYYLMRVEENFHESPKEMDNLVAAFEKADSLGVNVCSVSLGYASFDNDAWSLEKLTELDGKSTRVSRAATIAARKGMLIVVSAGNEGNSAWQTLNIPADADSVLTVGAVSTDSIIADFSSYGPTSDGRIKPEVCAVGKRATFVHPNGDIIMTGSGTSFATPLMAGFAASLWSALPDENAMQIRERIIRSAHLYPYWDSNNQMGYGIPDAWKAYMMQREDMKEVPGDQAPCTKVLRGEQILIIRHGHIYNLAGQRIE